jgi:hypothetical protein
MSQGTSGESLWIVKRMPSRSAYPAGCIVRTRSPMFAS